MPAPSAPPLSVNGSSYDLFISYAREDGAWVRDHLYEPLLLCRTPKGSRPIIFYDVGTEGIPAGRNYLTVLGKALQTSDRIVLVYSATYFNKPMCQWELTKALELDPTGNEGKLAPVLIDPNAMDRIPFPATHLHYIGAFQEEWFGQLCSRLGLTLPRQPALLEFHDQPADIAVNHTLPPLRVAVGEADREEEITLTAERGALQGTVTMRTVNGVATFRDLSVGDAASSTRLIASAEGCVSAFSRSFTVFRPEPVEIPQAEVPREEVVLIPGAGEALFFEDGKAVAVLRPGRAEVFDFQGHRLGEASFGRLRLVRRAGPALALAGWSGAVLLLFSDGRHHSWSFNGDGFMIPGDLQILNDQILAGCWDGGVHRLVPGQEPALELRHPAGVQGLAASGQRLYVCGLDGVLCVYESARVVKTYPLEPGVRRLKAYPRYLVAVGESRLYQHPFARPEILAEKLPLAGVAAVLGDGDCPVIIDAQGKGLRFDEDLVIRGSFHTVAGAIPVSADRSGRCSVFHNPDGSRSLMVDGRVVFTHLTGTLALSATAGHCALGGPEGIRLLAATPAQEIHEILQGGTFA